MNDSGRTVVALANTSNSAAHSTNFLQQATRFMECEIIGKAELVGIQTDVLSPF